MRRMGRARNRGLEAWPQPGDAGRFVQSHTAPSLVAPDRGRSRWTLHQLTAAGPGPVGPRSTPLYRAGPPVPSMVPHLVFLPRIRFPLTWYSWSLPTTANGIISCGRGRRRWSRAGTATADPRFPALPAWTGRSRGSRPPRLLPLDPRQEARAPGRGSWPVHSPGTSRSPAGPPRPRQTPSGGTRRCHWTAGPR